MTSEAKSSHRSRTAGIVVGLVAIIFLAVGFLVNVPATSSSYLPVAVVITTEHTFESSSTQSIPVPVASYASETYFTGRDTSLSATPLHNYDSYPALLPDGTVVQLSWNASGSVNVYIFNSTEYLAYTSSSEGKTSPNIFTASAASGAKETAIAVNDTYYLIIENPGNANVQYATSGSEVVPVSYTQYMTSTAAFVTSTQTVTTSTSTSTSVASCSHSLWSWLFGARSCP